jgi:hypothetical protein
VRQIEVAAPAERIEDLLPAIGALVRTPWCLRIDDDELPTTALISFVNNSAVGDNKKPVGFSRALLRYDPSHDRLERSHFLVYGPDCDFDRQWRLFQPKEVTYDTRLHSSGFFIEKGQRAPEEAQILHFDWILRSEAQRRAKLARYMLQSEAVARDLQHFTVAELIPRDWHLLLEFGGPRLAGFAREIYLRADAV